MRSTCVVLGLWVTCGGLLACGGAEDAVKEPSPTNPATPPAPAPNPTSPQVRHEKVTFRYLEPARWRKREDGAPGGILEALIVRQRGAGTFDLGKAESALLRVSDGSRLMDCEVESTTVLQDGTANDAVQTSAVFQLSGNHCDFSVLPYFKDLQFSFNFPATTSAEGASEILIASVLLEGLSLSACGASGAVSDRLADCDARNGALARRLGEGDSSWTLAGLSETGDSAWRDDETGIVWGFLLDSEHTHAEAVARCGESTAPFTSLPEKDVLSVAILNGLWSVLGGDRLWSATLVGDNPAALFSEAYVASRQSVIMNPVPVGTRYPVRCIAHP